MLTHLSDGDSFDFIAMMDEALDEDFAKVRPASCWVCPLACSRPSDTPHRRS